MTVRHIALKIVLRWRMYTLNKFIFTVFSLARSFSICPSPSSREIGVWVGNQQRMTTKGGSDLRVLSFRISAVDGSCQPPNPAVSKSCCMIETQTPQCQASVAVQFWSLSVDLGHVYFISLRFQVWNLKVVYVSLHVLSQHVSCRYSKQSMV